jgi:hypothetical protein
MDIMKKETEESTFSGTDALITNKQRRIQECEIRGQCLEKVISNSSSKTIYIGHRRSTLSHF